jgi:hypothetical protein
MSNDNGLIPPSPDIPIFSSTPYATRGPSITNTQISGIIPPNTTNYNNDGCYFIKKGSEPISNPLISPVQIFSEDLSKMAGIQVDDEEGFMALSTGANPNSGGAPALGMTLNSGPTGVIVSIGDITIPKQPSLLLQGQISGVETSSFVFDEVFHPVDAITPNPQVQVITPTGFSPNFGNIRPLFYDVSTNKIVVAQTSLIRFFEVATPEATGENVVITDPLGNTYSDPEWICCVAGFANGSGDRTYNCLTIQTAGSPWLVRYDSATTDETNYVNILCIHRSLLTGG